MDGFLLNGIDDFLDRPLLPDVPGRDVVRDETLLEPPLFLLLSFSRSLAMSSMS
jgi:hypothetical protein